MTYTAVLQDQLVGLYKEKRAKYQENDRGGQCADGQ